jgi:transcriptional regulator with XRE-family HTH domain
MRVRDPEQLRIAKEARGYSFRQLAELVGKSPGFISHLIPSPGSQPRKRSCRPEVAARIALALGQPVEVLFSHRGPNDPSTGELPIQREVVAPSTSPLRVPTVSTSGTRGRHRRGDTQ